MKICPNCQKEYDNALAFCAECGSQLVDVQLIVEEQQPVVPAIKFCMHCGNKMNSNSAFCAACGTPVNAVNVQSVNNTAVKPSINVNEYIDKIKNNETVMGFLDTLKTYVFNPAEALKAVAKNGDILAIAAPTVALFLSLLVFFVSVIAQALDDFEEGLGISIPVALITTLSFILIPSVTTFVVTKMNGKEYDFKGILSASSINMCYLVPIFVLAGVVSWIEFWDFGLAAGLFVFVIGIFVKVFLSISMLNQLADNILKSVKTFWIPTAIATVINLIVVAICGSILAEIIEEVINEFLFSSFDSFF
mgnify:CR=1 FL=1